MFISVVGPSDTTYTSDDYEKVLELFLDQALAGSDNLKLWEHEVFNAPTDGKDVTRDCLLRMAMRAGEAVSDAHRKHRRLLDLFILAEQTT